MQNRSFRRRSSQPISLLSNEKLDLAQQKQSHIYKIYNNIIISSTKTTARFGFVAFYDLRPGNETGLF